MTQPPKSYTRKSKKWGNRQGRTQRLNKLLPKLLGPVMQARGLTISKIITDWPHLAGEAAGWCEPQSLKFPPGKTTEGSLAVNVASGRGPEMQMATAEIISRINQLFGYQAVMRITITQVSMKPKTRPEPPANIQKSTPEEKTAFTAARSKIDKNTSPELKEALDNLGKSLADD
jgi:hypothetical protein